MWPFRRWSVLADDDDEPRNTPAATNGADGAAKKKRRRRRHKHAKKAAQADLGNPGTSVTSMVEEAMSHGFTRNQVQKVLDAMWRNGQAYDNKEAVLAELTKLASGKSAGNGKPKGGKKSAAAAAAARAAPAKSKPAAKPKAAAPAPASAPAPVSAPTAAAPAPAPAAAPPAPTAAEVAAAAAEDARTTAETLRQAAALPDVRSVLVALLAWRRRATPAQVATFFTCGALDTILENVLRQRSVSGVEDQLRKLLLATLEGPNCETVRERVLCCATGRCVVWRMLCGTRRSGACV